MKEFMSYYYYEMKLYLLDIFTKMLEFIFDIFKYIYLMFVGIMMNMFKSIMKNSMFSYKFLWKLDNMYMEMFFGFLEIWMLAVMYDIMKYMVNMMWMIFLNICFMFLLLYWLYMKCKKFILKMFWIIYLIFFHIFFKFFYKMKYFYHKYFMKIFKIFYTKFYNKEKNAKGYITLFCLFLMMNKIMYMLIALYFYLDVVYYTLETMLYVSYWYWWTLACCVAIFAINTYLYFMFWFQMIWNPMLIAWNTYIMFFFIILHSTWRKSKWWVLSWYDYFWSIKFILWMYDTFNNYFF